MSLLCDNNNYTKKKIISSIYNDNERWYFPYKLFQNMNIIQIFLAHFTFFVCHNFNFRIVYVLFGGMILGLKHIIFSIRIVQCLLYDDDYTDHYYFSYQCLYFRDLIKNESLHLTMSVVSSKLFPLDKGFYLLLHFYVKLHQ